MVMAPLLTGWLAGRTAEVRPWVGREILTGDDQKAGPYSNEREEVFEGNETLLLKALITVWAPGDCATSRLSRYSHHMRTGACPVIILATSRPNRTL